MQIKDADRDDQMISNKPSPMMRNQAQGTSNLESKRVELTQQYIKFQTQRSPVIAKKSSMDADSPDFYDSQSVYFES